jgi:hypothetical protein
MPDRSMLVKRFVQADSKYKGAVMAGDPIPADRGGKKSYALLNAD